MIFDRVEKSEKRRALPKTIAINQHAGRHIFLTMAGSPWLTQYWAREVIWKGNIVVVSGLIRATVGDEAKA